MIYECKDYVHVFIVPWRDEDVDPQTLCVCESTTWEEMDMLLYSTAPTVIE